MASALLLLLLLMLLLFFRLLPRAVDLSELHAFELQRGVLMVMALLLRVILTYRRLACTRAGIGIGIGILRRSSISSCSSSAVQSEPQRDLRLLVEGPRSVMISKCAPLVYLPAAVVAYRPLGGCSWQRV